MNKRNGLFSDAEQALLDQVLSQVEAMRWREQLKAQLASATVTRRTWTGVGLYVDFNVGSVDKLDAEAPTLFISSVASPDSSEGVDLLLYLSDGVISFLEVAASGAAFAIDEVISWINSDGGRAIRH